ncbi:MAG: carbohydrate ABC transporter permease, partial [Dehalococcoidia bacterium]|nr:carbohydrate ABC transporter permease [Dehalococcoidia bacterium]
MAVTSAPRASRRMTPWSWRSVVRSVAGHGVLIALCLITLFPLWWMVLTAIRPENEWVSPTPFPSAVTFDNFLFVWRSIPIANMLVNTLVMAVLITIGQLLICVLAGYAFARWEFRGSRFLFLAFLGTWLVPFQVIMIPNYVLVAQLGWLNTIWGLVVPQLATAFGIILMRQHMKSFPREL